MCGSQLGPVLHEAVLIGCLNTSTVAMHSVNNSCSGQVLTCLYKEEKDSCYHFKLLSWLKPVLG